MRLLTTFAEGEDIDLHTESFKCDSYVQDAAVLHTYNGKSSQSALIHELLEEAEDDKDPCSRICAEVSRLL